MMFSRSEYKGWAGLKNGELLKTAEDDGSDVFITGDQTLSYEQNLTGRRVDSAMSGSFKDVECGGFRRKKQPEI